MCQIELEWPQNYLLVGGGVFSVCVCVCFVLGGCFLCAFLFVRLGFNLFFFLLIFLISSKGLSKKLKKKKRLSHSSY